MAVAIRAYFDSSGKTDDPEARFITLAGYVGPPAAWLQFEKNWSEVLKHHNCQYLHMNEAHRLKGEFSRSKGWTTSRVLSLLTELFNECLIPAGWTNFKGQFSGASCTINLEDFRKVCNEDAQLKKKTAESICVDYV
jgi:hypothetical protein